MPPHSDSIQEKIIAFLSEPSSYAPPPERVERIESLIRDTDSRLDRVRELSAARKKKDKVTPERGVKRGRRGRRDKLDVQDLTELMRVDSAVIYAEPLEALKEAGGAALS